MTDENLVQSSTPVENAPTEKMVPQSEVDRVVGAVKHEAYERAKREMASQSNHGAQQMAQGALSEEQVSKMILEQTQKIQMEQARMAHAERVVGEFASKMDLGKDAYPDFEDTVKQMDLSAIPVIVQLANEVGNTSDVMYDLGKNPYKIAQLEILAAKSPNLARAEMMRLSKSIDTNKSAQAQVTAKEPLSQMKPSAGTVESDPNTLANFKSQKWARG
jgi:hypothetical protein